jgi:hypothetical protein
MIEEDDDTIHELLSVHRNSNSFNERIKFPRFNDGRSPSDETIKFSPDKAEIHFANCKFFKEVDLNDFYDHLTFENCYFYESFCADDSKLNGKVRFRECHFKGIVKFDNTRFEDLADFWRCTFYNKTTFLKTDFLGTTVFSAATFEQNVLFTYTLISKLIIFRGTNFDSGLDLSTAIISGELSVFDLRIEQYDSQNINDELSGELSEKDRRTKYEELYDQAITKNSEIPTENKVETFRILKNQLLDMGSAFAIDFNVLEKGAFRELLRNDRKKRIEDRVLLWFNRWSNNYGRSYLSGALFTLVFGWLFFYLSILGTSIFEFQINPANWNFLEGLTYYAQFLLPTHNVNYIEENASWVFYVFDFIGRIVVGYGIYQTIQAFRKYK